MEFDPTDRQRAILDSMNDKLTRDYQELVYDDAHAAYALVPTEIEPEGAQRLLRDVTDLFNEQAWGITPSLPRSRKPSKLAHAIYTVATHNGEGSVNSSSCAITELKLMLEELRGIPFHPTGLTGATITLGSGALPKAGEQQ